MKRKFELWVGAGGGQHSDPLGIVDVMERLENEGWWDGASVVDSQCIAPDPFAILALCAARTKRLKLSINVSNPVTRHPAVVAGAAATMQIISNGRFLLGMGRGDSALAYIGASPLPVGLFEHRLAMVQAYLRGDNVPLEEAAALLVGPEAGYEKLALAKPPPASWLKWLPEGHKKVPMEVVATGPKVIGIGARQAEQMNFVTGANIDRLKWCIQTARQAAEEAGRDPDSLNLGAMLLCRPHEDIDVARKLVEPIVPSMGRFMIMNRKIQGPVSENERANLERVMDAYNMKTHAQGGDHAKVIDTQFIDSYAIVGNAAQCAERLEEILDLGFKRLTLSLPTTGGERGVESHAMLVNEVLPAIKER